ncbi:D-2-hydroxyacid dehydrogenase [Tropicimonas sediminicola]|uniref:Glycerate dehydrogenase n=1 Tax=Tropicimonas sediminicola TaxID=1031541 RepID=A0A239LLC3_9RHOB|nr:D-2-hydroxyacid dehydrogenase [Tropicimonas sediminicola]SNT31175.1 glycerate dehydrogenase [Tropicimonas sediminicola]
MTDKKIVFLDADTLSRDVVLRSPDFAHEWTNHPATRPAEVVSRLAGAEIAVTNKVRLDRQHLHQLPALRLVAVAATGTDCVDKAACAELGITVVNIRDYAGITVPEHVFSLVLALRRNLVAYRDDVRAGRWQEAGQFCFHDHPIRDLAGSTIGIIGEGALGQGVAALARAFGMQVMFAAHKGVDGLGPLYTPWDDVLAGADVLSLHCPLIPATEGLLGLVEFEAMRRRPLIINTARGPLIRDEDLEIALDRGLVGGAGLDVTMPEPPAKDSAFMRLARRPDTIVTPHIAWASVEAQQTLADQLVDLIEAYAAGAPRNVVSGEF